MIINKLIQKIKQSGSTYSGWWLSQLRKFERNPVQLQKIMSKIEHELEILALRRTLIQQTKVNYPPELPVSQDIERIRNIISQNQVVIICGETGSGKTTQLPKALLELGYANNGLIGHTQPRRIAAKSLANRISQELGCYNNENNLVGYKMRFHDRTSNSTAIKLMTDGILLQEIQTDKLLLQYSALIIDEVHERSLNIDFILGYLQQLVQRRPDLKVIITSATIENEKLAKFFVGAPVVNVSGKTYPVDIVYQPRDADEDDGSLNQAIYQAISAAMEVERGNALVFLPGEREIKNCLNYLRKTTLKNYDLLPLYSRQNNEDQSLIFQESGRVKIILATNIAETSLTIPGIKFVIDSGIARVKRYSLRNRVEQLQIENVSQASSKQRAGRAGRVSHGMCVRLFSEQEYNLRPAFTEPELLRSNLANVILRLLSLNLGDPSAFPFLDQPENKSFNDGFRTLFQVGAIDDYNRLTPIGRKLANIPIDVQLARILIAAGEKFACLREALIVVSFLAIQDPREFPMEHQQLSRERHSIWADKQSEFMQILNIWQWYHEQIAHKKSNKKLLEICHKQFISSVRLREWHELHRQLKESLIGLGYRENTTPASYQNLHSAILSGFAVNVGQKDLVENHYLGTNGRKFLLHPSLNLDAPKWVLSANLVETTRLYARNCAFIEPQWLNGIVNHLYKYTYSNQHWDKKRGEVVAFKSALLYGLLIDTQRVSIGRSDPVLAQEIFIKEGLVANQLLKTYGFIQHNLQVIRAIEKLEDKLRTSLALLDDELYDFYAKILPAEVVDIPSLEQFILTNEKQLKINQEQLIERLTSTQQQLNLFPDHVTLNEQKIPLKYIFDHSSDEDGLVAIIDLYQLSLIENDRLDWLVSGMIRDKVAYLIKALPKSQRLQFNPLQDSVTQFLEFASPPENFLQEFMRYADKLKQIKLNYTDLIKIEFPVALRCHYRIMEKKKLVASGDNLELLKRELAPELSKIVVKHTSEQQIKSVVEYIPQIAELLQEIKLGTENKLTGYKSLIVEKDGSITFGVVNELAKARISSKRGLLALLKLQLKEQQKYLSSKKLPDFNNISLAFIDEYTKENLAKRCVDYILNVALTEALAENIVMSSVEFTNVLNVAKGNLSDILVRFSTVLAKTANLYQDLKLKLNNHPLEDTIAAQLDDLIYSDFLSYAKWQYFQQFPRYLQAILIRLSKYASATQRDIKLEDEINHIYNKWYNHVDELENKHKVINPTLYDFKYKIEELRISLFAQEVRTLYPVSSKRLLAELEQLYLQNLA